LRYVHESNNGLLYSCNAASSASTIGKGHVPAAAHQEPPAPDTAAAAPRTGQNGSTGQRLKVSAREKGKAPLRSLLESPAQYVPIAQAATRKQRPQQRKKHAALNTVEALEATAILQPSESRQGHCRKANTAALAALQGPHPVTSACAVEAAVVRLKRPYVRRRPLLNVPDAVVLVTSPSPAPPTAKRAYRKSLSRTPGGHLRDAGPANVQPAKYSPPVTRAKERQGWHGHGVRCVMRLFSGGLEEPPVEQGLDAAAIALEANVASVEPDEVRQAMPHIQVGALYGEELLGFLDMPRCVPVLGCSTMHNEPHDSIPMVPLSDSVPNPQGHGLCGSPPSTAATPARHVQGSTADPSALQNTAYSLVPQQVTLVDLGAHDDLTSAGRDFVRRVRVPFSALVWRGEVVRARSTEFVFGTLVGLYTGEGSSTPKVSIDFGLDLGVQVVNTNDCEDLGFLPAQGADRGEDTARGGDDRLEGDSDDSSDMEWVAGQEELDLPEDGESDGDFAPGEDAASTLGELGVYGPPPLGETFEERYREEMWHARSWKLQEPRPTYCGPPRGPIEYMGQDPIQPWEIFERFWDSNVMARIVAATNRYSQTLDEKTRKPKCGPRWKDLTVAEFKNFLSIVILMSQKKLPALRDYWKVSCPDYYDPLNVSRMSRDRFEAILRCLYLVDKDAVVTDRSNPQFDPLGSAGGSVRP
jgi:hypothetical protein